MVAKVWRAWSSAVEAFWKRSFQTSTGYVLWLCSEHFISVTRLLDVRCVALGENVDRKKIKQRLSQSSGRFVSGQQCSES